MERGWRAREGGGVVTRESMAENREIEREREAERVEGGEAVEEGGGERKGRGSAGRWRHLRCSERERM